MTDDKPKVQYAFWQDGDGDDDGYWVFHETLAEAVKYCPQGTAEIYRFTGKYLGLFMIKTHPVRVKKRKRKVKR